MKNRLKDSRLIKNILKLGFIIIGCLTLASFSPSLDGRAVVVEPGVFPEGLFAKTVGYLPGDIISVTNITGDSTIDILVIGALDPSEGVAIMLSPEAAAAIGINKDANNIVKITKRSNQDERVYGSAVIATNNTSEPAYEEAPAPVKTQPQLEPEPVAPVESQPVYEEEWSEPYVEAAQTIPSQPAQEEIYSIPVEEPVEEEPVTEYEYFDDEALPEYFEDDFVEESQPEYIEETPVEEELVPETPVKEEEPEIYEEFTDEGIDDLVEDEVEEEAFETIPAEESPVEEETAEPEEEIVEEEPVEEEPVEEELAPIEEEFFDQDNLEDLAEEEAEEEFVEEPVEEPVEEVPEAEPEEEFEEEEFEEEDFAEEFTDEEPEALPEEFVEEEPEELPEEISEEPVEEAAEEAEEEEVWSDEPQVLENDVEEYDAIVLVPADENPPVYEEEEYPEDDASVIVPDFTNIYNNEVEAPSVSVENNIVVQPSSSGNETSYNQYMVESLNELEAEKYYIQIATLRDDENILEIVNKYGSKYPITIVPTANGSKQVLVGPVTLDEYGTVLARFKAYGYKDAFLRKGTNPAPKARGTTTEKNTDAK